MQHVIEYWEMKGDRISQWTPYCLTCSWIGSDGTRAEAKREAAMHERGELQPWIIPEGVSREWTPEKHPVPGFKMS